MTSKYTSKLAEQRVLIFGSTSGIGFCVAENAFEHGAHLVLSSSNQSKLDKTVARLRETYPERDQQTIITQVCDLNDVDNLEANLSVLFKVATDDGKLKVNHIVSTAGNGVNICPIEDITPQAIYKGSNVRLVAQALIAKFIPKYVEISHRSSFTFTNGVRGKKPAQGWSLVSANASAVEGLMRGLAIELKPIRVNVVEPGAVHTELWDSFPTESLEPMLENFGKVATTGTVGKPGDVAESYIYIMKDSNVAGSTIETNGGVLLT